MAIIAAVIKVATVTTKAVIKAIVITRGIKLLALEVIREIVPAAVLVIREIVQVATAPADIKVIVKILAVIIEVPEAPQVAIEAIAGKIRIRDFQIGLFL